MTDIFSKKKRSDVMSKIKPKNTQIEMKMKHAFRAQKVKFTFQPRFFGRPDFLVGKNVLVFCDSGFWHGRNWERLKRKLLKSKNAKYWVAHIRQNKNRDRQVNRQLKKEGYRVVRLWDDEINKDPVACVMSVLSSKGKS